MQIAVIGTGFIGGVLGSALARSGQTVMFTGLQAGMSSQPSQ